MWVVDMPFASVGMRFGFERLESKVLLAADVQVVPVFFALLRMVVVNSIKSHDDSFCQTKWRRSTAGTVGVVGVNSKSVVIFKNTAVLDEHVFGTINPNAGFSAPANRPISVVAKNIDVSNRYVKTGVFYLNSRSVILAVTPALDE